MWPGHHGDFTGFDWSIFPITHRKTLVKDTFWFLSGGGEGGGWAVGKFPKREFFQWQKQMLNQKSCKRYHEKSSKCFLLSRSCFDVKKGDAQTIAHQKFHVQPKGEEKKHSYDRKLLTSPPPPRAQKNKIMTLPEQLSTKNKSALGQGWFRNCKSRLTRY